MYETLAPLATTRTRCLGLDSLTFLMRRLASELYVLHRDGDGSLDDVVFDVEVRVTPHNPEVLKKLSN